MFYPGLGSEHFPSRIQTFFIPDPKIKEGLKIKLPFFLLFKISGQVLKVKK
jgi:hypothetical protein